MIRNVFKTTLLSAFVFVGSSVFASAGETLKVDATGTVLNWSGKKVTGAHNGKISVKAGELTVSGANITGGKVTVDMNSMTCEDITDAETNGKFLGHMKSEDFFDVKKFPTAEFAITKVSPLKSKDAQGNTHEIEGNMTIRGKTNPVKFPAKVEMAKGSLKASGELTIDRTQFDIKYGSGKFFKGLADKAINDEFKIGLNLVAKK